MLNRKDEKVQEDQSVEPPGIFADNTDSLWEKPVSAESVISVPLIKWNDWRWQMRNRIRSYEQLVRVFPALKKRKELQGVMDKYPMAITPYYASKIQETNYSDPIFALSVPHIQELSDSACLSDDPLEEHCDMPVPGLVHRYRDRALVIATTMCSMYCRHCTRKRITGMRENSISTRRMKQIVEYLRLHPEITDVIVSGGDPLTMPDSVIDMVLSSLRSVSSVEVIRIGTRVPVVLPMRITEDLVNIIRKYHPVWINTHFNHSAELTPEARAACARLADAGIPLGNQTVLLKGINDSPQIIEKLCRTLVKNRVRPYYLYQCDLVRGVEHLRTSVRKGIEIMEYMRGRVGGIAIPTFVVDVPHGGGKIPVLPNYIISMSESYTVFRNYEGMIVSYPEPGTEPVAQLIMPESQSGVWEVSAGIDEMIMPEKNKRMARRRENSPGIAGDSCNDF